MGSKLGAVGPLAESDVETVLRSAALAPSVYNTQPWAFRRTDHDIELHGDFSRGLAVADQDNRELVLSCGAALFNLRAAVHRCGCLPVGSLRPRLDRPSLLAVVRPVPTGAPDPAMVRLASAIPHRSTIRSTLTKSVVAEARVVELRRAAEAEHAWLVVLAGAQLVAAAALIATACRQQLEDSGFRSERARWAGRHRPDGLPGTAEHRRAPVSAGAADELPLLVVIGSFEDGPIDRLRVGQALQRVLLTATLAGLDVAFRSAPVELAGARRELRELAGGAIWPQVLLELGKGRPTPRTPRRAIEDLLR
ncbi:Acg family FMN-binding oxidoreductase [Amycolatopsis sp. RTGN1]|uniref:Acg family FMN-binding oxidoreductase n=1 Tax=Amycolatopsis ponsaeliensis TaxID=2992142 RepID=UPI0025500F86|nr:hypothetical protein [Amycolatopsis sp. RTGN1]